MSQNDNARRFLDAYASIEHELSTMARETRYIPFSQLLSMCAKHSWVVSHHEEELREFNELRNAIVHLRDSRNEIIAQPTDQAVQDIERLAKLLTGDDTLLQYASKPVKTVSLQDTIPSAYTLMKKLGSSKVPVYENGIYRGLLQMEDICAWAMDGRDASLQVKDVLSRKKILVRGFVSKKSGKTYDAAQNEVKNRDSHNDNKKCDPVDVIGNLTG